MRKLKTTLLVVFVLFGVAAGVLPVYAQEADMPQAEDAAQFGTEMFDPSDSYGLQDYRLPPSEPGDKPRVACTWDDGSSTLTPKLLDVLDQFQDVHCTFFVNCRQSVPGTFQRILDSGHAIASHGCQHVKFTTISCSKVQEYVLGVEKFVNARIDEPIDISLVRFPWGAYNSSVVNCVGSINYKWKNWSLDCVDWTYPGWRYIRDCLAKAQDGDVILLHDSYDKYDSVEGFRQFLAKHHGDYEWVLLDGAGYYEPCEKSPAFEDLCADHWGAPAAEWAKANGVTFGCNADHTRLCGDRIVTNGEDAAFVARQIKPEPADKDFFTDDDGHLFERHFNDLANIGIYRGCNPPDNTKVCPDRQDTRGAKFVKTARRLHLPTTTVDYFTDDDGLWYESSANSLAEAGILIGCNPPDNTRACGERKLTRIEDIVFEKRIADWLQRQ